jgi:hypothetical protein
MFDQHIRDYLIWAAPIPHREAIKRIAALNAHR